ncbi:hypothetical protein L228DRAFT_261531 [Xylona heveae TC161]|uniref:Double-strand-break repair protein rad21 n=1 Tax=Xylona heveae (strain CBS 132557 / TC161) TaxID=1328760 RepID=A0A165GLW0_XYLHT|nr:hypothetical protein L228DRAFT_261531 [Xylona heveae TC161]KZF22352.1 hypothetical protein L228DRAFT_261531 [Xylona heveae TC161]
MFYSETLLSKTGPLARVWLSANLERKLSKTHILQSNIESSVNAIVDQGQAPMALRLSGQLLLGVVRIYSRKARYLLDDCNEALMKIKMAFRPGNVDLPANQLNAPNPGALTLPDVLTELDLLAPMPDDSLLLTQPPPADLTRDESLGPLDWTSQLLPGNESVEQGRNAPAETFLDDDGIVLDLGEDVADPAEETSIHVGRDAPPARPVEEDLMNDDMKLYDEDLELDLGDDEPLGAEIAAPFPTTEEPEINLGGDDDIPMANLEDEDDVPPLVPDTPGRQERDSQSPLSSVRPSVEREFEMHLDDSFAPEQDEVSAHHAHRAKKRKVMAPDADTILHASQIKQLQDDRSKILKPASFLPRDPMLLTLMSMQRNGGFVSNILGEGRGKGWAPELRGILSLEVVRQSGDLKRKRDAGAASARPEEGLSAEKELQLEIPEEEPDFAISAPFEGNTTLGGEPEVINIPAAEEDIRAPLDDEDMGMAPPRSDEDEHSPPPDVFDDTTAPLVHPADSGPVSLGTKHAVHLLREHLDASETEGPSHHGKKSVLFQDLLPERNATKADATKMFFETLVLATKDAIKVEQTEKSLGGPIRVRAKRGLWGDWAEMEAGGEIAETERATATA